MSFFCLTASDFLFLLVFEKCDYNISRCVFLKITLLGILRVSLVCCLDVFYYFWKIRGYYLSKYFFSPSFFSFWDSSYNHVNKKCYCSIGLGLSCSLTLFLSFFFSLSLCLSFPHLLFFSLCFNLGNLCGPIFSFTDSFLSYVKSTNKPVKSANEPVKDILYFISTNMVLVLFLIMTFLLNLFL